MMALQPWKPTVDDPLPEHVKEYLDLKAQRDAGLKIVNLESGKHEARIQLPAYVRGNRGEFAMSTDEKTNLKTQLRKVYNILRMAYLDEAKADMIIKINAVNMMPPNYRPRAEAYVAAYAESLDPRRKRNFTPDRLRWMQTEDRVLETEVKKRLQDYTTTDFSINSQMQALRRKYLEAKDRAARQSTQAETAVAYHNDWVRGLVQSRTAPGY